MPLPPSIAWKLVVVLVLVGGILLSACARAPRRPLPSAELRRLVLAALTLYAVGVYASLTHHASLAGIVCVSGISTCALAAWLSRGGRPEDRPDDDGPVDREPPPPEPDGLAEFAWATFERRSRAPSAGERELAGAGR
ncbi:MAG: hypothetical protein JO262_10375 [Solirubrobacterales bacterium]|nr:hypothetical protein [Solirubrobacterales bacterium]